MKKQDKEKALTEAARKKLHSEKVPEPPPTATTPPSLTSRQVPRVHLVRGSQQEQDILATRALTDAHRTPDGYQCPTCPYKTANMDDYFEHLETEINKAMQHIEGMASRDKIPPLT